MKIKVNVGDITEAMAQASLTKDRMTNTPMGHVYIRASRKDTGRGFLYVYSTNLLSETLIKIPAEVEEEGEAIFDPGQMTIGLAGRAREDSVTVATTGMSKISVRYSRNHFQISMPLNIEFLANRVKKMPLADKSKASIKGAALGEFCRRSVFCIPSQDSSRAGSTLCGLYLTDDDNGIAAYASDGNIAVKTRIATEQGKLGRFMIPVDALSSIERLLGRRKDDVIDLVTGPETAPGTGPSMLYFRAGDIVLGTGLLASNLENLKGIVSSKTAKFNFQVNRADMKSAVDRAAGFTDDKSRTLRMEIKADVIEIKAKNIHGENNDYIDIEHRAEFTQPVKLGVNMDYLANIASGSKTSMLEVGISGSLDPIIITDKSDSVESRYVLMPVRL